MTIQVYQPEIDAGLSDSIQNNRISVACDLNSELLEKANAVELYSPNEKEFEKKVLPDGCIRVNSILVTTNWNRNDDVFSPDELWASRFSPYYKPANTDHNNGNDTPNNIIGFIDRTYPVDDNYKEIVPGESGQMEIPPKFHLMIGSILWEYNFPKIIGNLKKDIADNKMFVSMECIFRDFGYALQAQGSDDIHLISRTPETSQLTKTLRIFKGRGKVEINGTTYKIGRWLKKIDFVGVAFLKKPANPESIVFNDFVSKASFINLDEFILENNFENFDPNCVLTNKREISLWPK